MYSPNYSSDGVPPPLPPPVSSYRFFLPPPSCFPSLLPHDDDHRSSPGESSTFSVPRPRPPLASPPPLFLSLSLSLYRLGVARMAGHYRGDGGREKKDGKRPLLILCEEGLRGEPREGASAEGEQEVPRIKRSTTEEYPASAWVSNVVLPVQQQGGKFSPPNQ